MLASLSKALPFSKHVWGKTLVNSWGLKYLTTAVTSEETVADVEFRTAKTSVWWDVENCGVPKGCGAEAIEQNIRLTLRKSNYCGSLSIYAYGDINQISSSVQQVLSSTGISLNHVPPGVKEASDKKIIVDMLLWAMENQAPANIMLISGDRDFSYVLSRLRMIGYNVLLIRPDIASIASPLLISASNRVWFWRS